MAIFTLLTFQGNASDLGTAQLTDDAELKTDLAKDGYKVALFEGGNATLGAFKTLGDYGIVIINTHGVHGTGPLRDTFNPGGTVIDSYTVPDDVEAAKLQRAGLSDGWFFLSNGIVELTAQGISALMHTGGSGPPTIVFNSSCFSYEVAAAYGAHDYIGYTGKVKDASAAADQKQFFTRLLGDSGIDQRTSDRAFSARGYTAADTGTSIGYWHQQGQPATVLAPAVKSLDPSPDKGLALGRTTSVTIKFDASMERDTDKADVVISAGCGPVSNMTWTDDTTLTFDVNVPRRPVGTAEGIVFHAKTDEHSGLQAASGYQNGLDGNTTPASNGDAPNGDDYRVVLPCKSGLNLFVNGTVNGQAINGRVLGPYYLACTSIPQSNYNAYQVQWSGHLAAGNAVITGEFIGPAGAVTFGTNDPSKIGNANISFAGIRFGGGIDGGTGTLTMTSPTSGTIDAQLSTNASVHVAGSWDCASQ